MLGSTAAEATGSSTLGCWSTRGANGKATLRLLALVAILCGCADTGITQRPVSYGETARSNYEKGESELRDENFAEAIKYFTFVKSRFPFSRYATLAELRIADAYYAQEKFLEAADAYKLFTKFHPTHPRVLDGYAAYRVCEAYVKQIPSDWFIVPPSHEKDQSFTRDALRELSIFLRAHADSKYLPKVKKLYRRCVRKLADHELYVARFYLDRDKPKAAILRLETVLRRYPDAGVHPQVMLLLGKTYLGLEQLDKARETFVALAKQYADDPNGAKARLYLDYIEGRKKRR